MRGQGHNEAYADANGGSLTKYAALFDTRAVFDTLRVSFLRVACGPRLVRLEDALGAYLASEEQTDAEGTAAVLEYLDRCREYFDLAREIKEPEWLEDAAWPTTAYYLSA